MGNRDIRPKWVLASASPRRNEILRRLGLKFRVDPCGIPEPHRKPREIPSRYVVRVARFKAEEVAKRYGSAIVLGADTVVVLGKSVLVKPPTRAEARLMLKRLSGRWHEVISGICLLDCGQQRTYSAFSRSRVHFRRLSSAQIEWYLKTGEHRDKAGAYGAQGYASLFINRIDGCYFNIVGFPIAAFEKICRRAGIDLIAHLNQASQSES